MTLPRHIRAIAVIAALLLGSAACSGVEDPATEAPPTPTQQDATSAAREPATTDSPAEREPQDQASENQEPAEPEAAFAACEWGRGAPVPIAANVNELAARWDAAARSIAPDSLTTFDVSTAYSVTDHNQIPDGSANYVGDRAFLAGVTQNVGLDAVSLLLDPESPVLESSVRAFVAAILGPDAPDGAAEQVLVSLNLFPDDNLVHSAFVHDCAWQTNRQPLSTEEDDLVYVLTAVAAEGPLSQTDDIARWLFSEQRRTLTTLFVRDARRWNGQSDG